MTDLFPEIAPTKGDNHNERFTTTKTMEWCKRVAGVEEWDVDVAACAEWHWAPRYFTREADGLRQRWDGRVWCNPPYDDLEPWVSKAWLAWLHDKPEVIAMLVPANRAEQPWWQNWVERFRDGRGIGNVKIDSVGRLLGEARLTGHFLPGRVNFGHPGNPEGIGVGSPPFGCVLLVWRFEATEELKGATRRQT